MKFMAGTEQEAEEDRAAFAVEEQHLREAATAEESDDDDFNWSRPDSEEKPAQQRVLVASFKTLKKTEDDANKAMRRWLLEDVAAHRAPATARQIERQAAEKLRREGGNDRTEPSTTPRGNK
ncbi:hypothetical protein QYE76_000104 [Lolium multiflorum]|uniref:Uncharacterized protein n=1 Tax=Lolium multiflorum TaxID=4521 RepID=A0AAD8QIR3_LOLMU|nr:hypothetical protein QYE76_000104 [Lolium multiflorum]